MVIVINRVSVLSLILARILYSVNWFNIASIFYFIAADFKEDTSMLGLITSSFLIGIGIFHTSRNSFGKTWSKKDCHLWNFDKFICILSFKTIYRGTSHDNIEIYSRFRNGMFLWA